MEDRFELITFEHAQLPIKVFLHKIGNVNPHWHNATEILYMISGNCKVSVNNQSYSFKEEDLIVINAGDIHSLYSNDGATLIALQIDLDSIPFFKSDTEFRFDVNTVKDDSKKTHLSRLKKDIVNLIKVNSSKDSYDLIKTIIVSAILQNLIENFQTSTETNLSKNLDKMKQITKYIKDNYQENLTLEGVADHFNVTPQYFSSFFKKNLGTTFSSYYSDVRLEKTLKDLLNCNDPIFDVVIRNGYEEPRTFTRAFKKKYGNLPSEYRRNNIISKTDICDNDVNYLNLSEDSKMNILSKFFVNEDKNFVSPFMVNENFIKKNTVIDCNDILEYQKNISNVSVGVGRAKELLFTDIQEMLLEAKKEINFHFVNFHGIISDEMMVVTKKQGKLFFSFALIDKVLDFLIYNNLKPILQIDFMPELLAKDKYNRIFNGEAIISLPENLELWKELMIKLFQHIKYKYGHHEVSSWIYTLWNEPDSERGLFNVGTPTEFYNFYKVTYDVLKQEIPGARFGGCPFILCSEKQKNWTKEFLSICKSNDNLPLFLELHYYHNEYLGNCNPDGTGSNTEVFKKSDHALLDYYNDVRSFLKQLDIDLPFYLGEFNATFSHRNYINDTLFNADFFIKNYIENYNHFYSYSPWCLTDFIQENPLPKDLLHGGLGLMTTNGIKKPSFFAYVFLSTLCNTILKVDDNFIVTKDDTKIVIVAHNYKHYNEKYRVGERFNVTNTSRYGIYQNDDKLQIVFDIAGINSKYAIIRKYFVNRNEGSVYDEWIKEGAFDTWDNNSIKSLIAKSNPGFHQEVVKIKDNKLEISTKLDALEIQKIDVIWRDSLYED